MFKNNLKHSHLNVTKGFVHYTCNSSETECVTTWHHQWLDPLVGSTEQQRSPEPPSGLPEPLEQLPRGPLTTGSSVPLLQNAESSALARQNCNAAHSSCARAEEHRTCPMHSPPHRAHHTLTIWELCWGRFIGWFTASSDRNINVHNHLSLKNSYLYMMDMGMQIWLVEKPLQMQLETF